MQKIIVCGLLGTVLLFSGCGANAVTLPPTILENSSNHGFGVELKEIPKCPEQKLLSESSSTQVFSYIKSIETKHDGDNIVTTPIVDSYELGKREEIQGCIDNDKNGSKFIMLNINTKTKELDNKNTKY